jgi:hypothetical protein
MQNKGKEKIEEGKNGGKEENRYSTNFRLLAFPF